MVSGVLVDAGISVRRRNTAKSSRMIMEVNFVR